MKFCRIIKILINHYFTWFLSTCKQLQPCLVPGCLLVINYKSRYSRRHSHKRRNNYTSNGILFTLANNKNSNLRETEPRSLAMSCFTYILDNSNSTSITFWASQFGSSSRSNWIGIWTGNSNDSEHFSTAKEMNVKATFFFM